MGPGLSPSSVPYTCVSLDMWLNPSDPQFRLLGNRRTHLSPEDCAVEQTPKLGPRDSAAHSLGFRAWSVLGLAGEGWTQGWRRSCEGPEIWCRDSAPLPHSQGAPRLFVLSQQLSIEMNAISRGFTSDKCPSAAAARILMCTLEFNGHLS